MTAKLKRNLTKVKDPGSALTHFIAMILAMIAAMPLLMKAVRDSGHLHVSALAIFILSMIGLYAASTIYHTLDISPQINQMLRDGGTALPPFWWCWPMLTPQMPYPTAALSWAT